MAEPHLDNHDDIKWFPNQGPARVLGPCPHVCRHEFRPVIAWGTDMKHYVLVRCDADCGGRCRAWTDGGPDATTEWLHVEEAPDAR